MAGTEEQVAADRRLRDAIVGSAAAAWPGEDYGLLTDWVVVGAWQSFDDDGEAATAVARLVDDSLPLHRQLGLLEFAAARVRKLIAED